MRYNTHHAVILGHGNLDVPAPPRVVEAVRRGAAAPSTQRFIVFGGLKILKRAAANWDFRRYDVTLDPETENCVLIGAKLRLQEIGLCLLDEGDICHITDRGI